jgi:hypothetical protein
MCGRLNGAAKYNDVCEEAMCAAQSEQEQPFPPSDGYV